LSGDGKPNPALSQWIKSPCASFSVATKLTGSSCDVKVDATYPEGMEAAMAGKKPEPFQAEHKEAVRLSWKARHIPVGTLLLGVLLLVVFLSAVSMVISQGPHNPIP
jgi:hypothetical protein